MHFFNVKKAFKKVDIILETFQAKQIVRRFDSNYDEELSFSDVHDMFKTSTLSLNQELERRTVFAPIENARAPSVLTKQSMDYIKDLFELFLQAGQTQEKIRIALAKRPNCSVKKALQVIRLRGSSDLAIEKL